MKIQDFHKTNSYELTNLCVDTFKTHTISEYFNQTHNRLKFYVVLKGKKTGFFHTWIEVIEAIQGFNDPLYKGFNDYQQALTVARMHLGMNFYNFQQPAIIDISSGSSSDPELKSKKGTHSPMSDTEGTSKPEKLLASPVSPATGKDLSNPVIAMGLLKSQGTQRTPDFSTDKNMEPQRTPLSSIDKNKQPMNEIWDSLGEPGKHGDFLVKYNPTPTTDNPEFPSFTLLTESPASSNSKNTQRVPTDNENPKTYEASSSRKYAKKKKYDKKTLQETINETVQEILKTMLPKYDNPPEKNITEDDSKTDSLSHPQICRRKHLRVGTSYRYHNTFTT
ncbi:hypothetical protein LXL04_020575 [Taraxacum kok-saghyz]